MASKVLYVMVSGVLFEVQVCALRGARAGAENFFSVQSVCVSAFANSGLRQTRHVRSPALFGVLGCIATGVQHSRRQGGAYSCYFPEPGSSRL